MSTNVERLRGSQPEKGRRYEIDAVSATEAMMVIENTYPKYNSNVDFNGLNSYVDHSFDSFKNFYSVDYDEISFKPKISREGLKYGGRFGVIRAATCEIGIDLKDNSGTILVGASDPVIEIQVMKVNFSLEYPNALITLGIMSRSFASLAEYLKPRSLRVPPMLMGLTHPRMGQLSRRWGFEVVDSPFSPEVYSIIEEVGEQVKFEDPDELENLQKIGQQVMVYQPTAKFIDLHSRAAK